MSSKIGKQNGGKNHKAKSNLKKNKALKQTIGKVQRHILIKRTNSNHVQHGLMGAECERLSQSDVWPRGYALVSFQF